MKVLDPTSERAPAERARVARPPALAGLTVGLLDISKPRGNVFLDRVEELLRGRGAAVRRYAKPTFTKPAPIDVRHEISTQCDVVIEALADWGSCTSCSVHDIADLEGRGIPAMFVASTEFVDAAATQAGALGFADAARVFVPHPIQDRTDEEMRDYADAAFEEIVARLVSG